MFNYSLPKEKIACWPMAAQSQRDSAKLLHAHLLDGRLKIDDLKFKNLEDTLQPGDLLILNNTKVVPRRFFTIHKSKDREIEVLLLTKTNSFRSWKAMAKPMAKLKIDDILIFSPDISAKVGERLDDGRAVELHFESQDSEETFLEQLDQIGVMPIPPYIRSGRGEDLDKEYYQTVFAEQPGSIAAPTAGLHFTKALLGQLANKNISSCYITLHVGAASFKPIEDSANTTEVDEENYCISSQTLEAIEKCKNDNRRVVAVGTTTVRALESHAIDKNFQPDTFQPTKLFIKPGHNFRIVDALITNFHQPSSTHLSLVSAFYGEEKISDIYKHALSNDYRFLSYGDSMFLDNQ